MTLALAATAQDEDDDRHPTAELWKAITPEFLALVGWSAERRVLTFPQEHPLLGWRKCTIPDCDQKVLTASGLCAACNLRWKRADRPDLANFVAVARVRDRRLTADRCVVPDCQRFWRARTGLCAAHEGMRRRRRLSLEELFRQPDLKGFEPLGSCAVPACTRDRDSSVNPYCAAHLARWRLYRERTDTTVADEEQWRRRQPAIAIHDQVSLRGLPDRIVAEMLFGLQQHVAAGVQLDVSFFRRLGDHMRSQGVSSIDDADMDGFTLETRTLGRHFVTSARRLRSTPETERHNDVWDLAVFGFAGLLRFDDISQTWLRAAAKAHAYNDLPRRRGQAGKYCQSQLNALGLLSESLRLQRTDGGVDLTTLARSDITAFLNRLAFLQAEGEMTDKKRARTVREVRRTLAAMRALGLTRAGQPLHGLPDDFTLLEDDQPQEADDAAVGRDLPTEVMRHLCQYLDQLEARSFPELRVAVELMIDTGRRPEEICQLGLNCLARDGAGKPVLIYDNVKANRLQRRLPIPEATAVVIERQQQRVRAGFPNEPESQLKLLPAPMKNPHGTKGTDASNLGVRHRQWVRSLPEISIAVTAVTVGEAVTKMVPFDKARIFPYAYRHTYAQRHADAGVPVDTLRELMDHVHLITTQGYYRVGEERRRDAVDRVTAMQFDRHGNRVWRHAKTLLDTEHLRRVVGEVAVPYGSCSEPSNVTAGGTDCPVRFRCVGCAHFSTDVSYLPDLEAYLADLLRTREKLISFAGADEWAKNEVMPSDEEITRVRRLISRITADVDDLSAEERSQIEQSVSVVRRARNGVVGLGLPKTRQPLPDIRPDRIA